MPHLHTYLSWEDLHNYSHLGYLFARSTYVLFVGIFLNFHDVYPGKVFTEVAVRG